MKAYADLADFPEDKRIAVIASTAAEGQIVGVVVEDDEKADRYVVKILAASQQVRVIDRGPGPVKGTVLVRIGPKGH